MITLHPEEAGFEAGESVGFETVPRDILDWQALIATMQRTGASLMELTDRDVMPEDRQKAESDIRETTSHMKDSDRQYYFESLKKGMEFTQQSIENGRRYIAAFNELVKVIGKEKGEQLKRDFIEVHSYLLEQGKQTNTYEPFTLVTETARVAVQRMVDRGVGGRELIALRDYLNQYNLLTGEMFGNLDREVAEQTARDEERMAGIRAQLS